MHVSRLPWGLAPSVMDDVHYNYVAQPTDNGLRLAPNGTWHVTTTLQLIGTIVTLIPIMFLSMMRRIHLRRLLTRR